MSARLALCVLAAVFSARGSAAQDQSGLAKPCAEISKGRFNLALDLLVVNYDIKPDVDDIHSAAAFATFASRFKGCFNYAVVAGTYGIQGGEFVPAYGLFDRAFSYRWFNAHERRFDSLNSLAKQMKTTLRTGGHVWIAEGGQSDFTADLVEQLSKDKRLKPSLRSQIHVVQHSDWNEQTTTPAKLAFVKSATAYRRIADGNTPGNGTPDFAIDDTSWWPRLLRDSKVGGIWAEAKSVADWFNPKAAYVNPAVAKGGMDFSDTVEIAYIFGFDDMADHSDFFDWLINQ